MAEYKVVNATQLDADLQSVADKLKENVGSTEPLPFPGGFKDVADTLGNTIDGILDRTITSIKNNMVTTIAAHAFRGCSLLVEADFGAVTEIKGNSFNGCSKLTSLTLRNNTVCELEATSAFTSTGIKNDGDVHIYVPAALVDAYKSATNWSTYADIITSIAEV